MKDDDEDQKKSTAVAQPELDFFGQYANAALGHRITGDLMLFNKFGDFVAGRERGVVALGTKLVAHMVTLSVGWVRWEANRPVEYKMGEIAKGFKPARRDTLAFTDKAAWETDDEGEPRDPWQLTNHLILSDPKTGDLFTFSTSSKGGITALGELAKDYSDHNRQSPGEYPVIALGRSSYQHPNRSIGEVRTPKLTVASWVPRKGPDGLLSSGSGDGGDGDNGAAPNKSRKPPATPRI